MSSKTPQGKTPMQQSAKEELNSIVIPRSLYLRIQKRLEKTDFKSVEEYVAYVLDQVLNELEADEGKKRGKSDTPFSKEEQENVEQRLRDLGYL